MKKSVTKNRWETLVSTIVIILIISIILKALGVFFIDIGWTQFILRTLSSLIVLGLIYYFVVKKMINKK